MEHSTKITQGLLKRFEQVIKIRFIEPIPQFINNIGTGNSIFNFSDRYPMHKEFVFHLREKCKELNLPVPLSPEKIFEVDKFEVYLETRCIRQLQFKTPAEFKQCFLDAEVIEKRWTLAKK